MVKETIIIFNDLIVAKTKSGITYERETPIQKEYCFMNTKSGLVASFFAEDLIVLKNDIVVVEIKK